MILAYNLRLWPVVASLAQLPRGIGYADLLAISAACKARRTILSVFCFPLYKGPFYGTGLRPALIPSSAMLRENGFYEQMARVHGSAPVVTALH